jgi:hypothetical protein
LSSYSGLVWRRTQPVSPKNSVRLVPVAVKTEPRRKQTARSTASCFRPVGLPCSSLNFHQVRSRPYHIGGFLQGGIHLDIILILSNNADGSSECTVEMIEGVYGMGYKIGIGEPGVSLASPPTPPRHAGPHRAVRQVEVMVLDVVRPAHRSTCLAMRRLTLLRKSSTNIGPWPRPFGLTTREHPLLAVPGKQYDPVSSV